MGIIKNGKVVIMLAGRHAGKKAIVIKTFDDGSGDRKFPHAVVAGIERYPRKITKATPKAKATKRSKIKPFVKCVNFNHMMPTRYKVDIDLKKVIGDELKTPEKRHGARKQVKEIFEGRYLNQSAAQSEKKGDGVTYFFRKLRF